MLFNGTRKTPAIHLWKASQEDPDGYQEQENAQALRISGKQKLPEEGAKLLNLKMEARRQLCWLKSMYRPNTTYWKVPPGLKNPSIVPSLSSPLTRAEWPWIESI